MRPALTLESAFLIHNLEGGIVSQEEFSTLFLEESVLIASKIFNLLSFEVGAGSDSNLLSDVADEIYENRTLSLFADVYYLSSAKILPLLATRDVPRLLPKLIVQLLATRSLFLLAS